jgi:hypothetical protein
VSFTLFFLFASPSIFIPWLVAYTIHIINYSDSLSLRRRRRRRIRRSPFFHISNSEANNIKKKKRFKRSLFSAYRILRLSSSEKVISFKYLLYSTSSASPTFLSVIRRDVQPMGDERLILFGRFSNIHFSFPGRPSRRCLYIERHVDCMQNNNSLLRSSASCLKTNKTGSTYQSVIVLGRCWDDCRVVVYRGVVSRNDLLGLCSIHRNKRERG